MILALKFELTAGATILKLRFGHLNMSISAHISHTYSRKGYKHILFYKKKSQFYLVELEKIKIKDSWS